MDARVALVTGAGGPLGRATALSLAGAGFTVVAIDRNEQALRELANSSDEASRELADDIRLEMGDTTDPAVARSLVDRIAAEIGAPDVLVNTIGAFRLGEALTTTPADLRAMIDVNLGAALWLSQAVGSYMRQRGSGAIVHVSARPGIEPTAGMAAYSISKAALAHLTRLLDIELRPHGIRVNAVVPQLLDTPRNRAAFAAGEMVHAVQPEAIADIIAFLVSDIAAPISGALLPAYGA